MATLRRLDLDKKGKDQDLKVPLGDVGDDRGWILVADALQSYGFFLASAWCPAVPADAQPFFNFYSCNDSKFRSLNIKG